MKVSKLYALLFFQFVFNNVFSSSGDSLRFIHSALKYACDEIKYTPKRELFSLWAQEEKPYIYIYVSQSDSIRKPEGMTAPFIFCGTDEIKAGEEILRMNESGYHTFCYKTYANSGAYLNKRLLSYRNDAIAFIVFHEVIHNYLKEYEVKIPYIFEEALCDVVGNYGALKYSKSFDELNRSVVKGQIRRNEKIYKCLNATISRTIIDPNNVITNNSRCESGVQNKLKHSNTFQRDRFNYPVNNAYLLKNQYYSKYYFLLRKVYLKQKSLKSLLVIMKGMPTTEYECEIYLRRFI